jgi:hydrogenase maturation protease
MKTLLLGMGNPILCDDAVGVRLAHEFSCKLAGIAGLDILEECCVGGLNLLDIFKGYDRVIVLDSIQTADGVAGDWYYFTASALHETLHLTNIHDVNFATALEFGRAAGMPLPISSNIHILAVEVSETRTFAEQMTRELESTYGRFAPAIFEEVTNLLRT